MMLLITATFFTLFLPSSSLLLFYDNYPKYSADYCNMELFNITCPSQHVIMIVSSMYGRMNIGRCMRQDYGKDRCYINSFPFLDAKCSGRQECIFQVPDVDLYNTKPCPADFTSYLEGTHTCVPVISANVTTCHSYRLLRHLDNGFISSLVPNTSSSFHSSFSSSSSSSYPSSLLSDLASSLSSSPGSPGAALSSEVGTFRCPWLLEAHPGQRFNISLHIIMNYKYRKINQENDDDDWSFKKKIDSWAFSAAINPHNKNLHSSSVVYLPHNHAHGDDACVEVGAVVDGGVGKKVVKVCQSDGRLEHVTLTKSHVARIEFNNLSLLNELGIFIFEFAATGCPSIQTSGNSWHRIVGNFLTIYCNLTKQEFKLECKGTSWHGHMGNCSDSSSHAHEVSKLWGLNQMFGSEDSFPFGVLLAVSIGVAMGIVIGGFLLCMITFYLKRQRQASSFSGYNAPKEQQHFLTPSYNTPLSTTQDDNLLLQNNWMLLGSRDRLSNNQNNINSTFAGNNNNNNNGLLTTYESSCLAGKMIKKFTTQPLKVDLCEDNSDVLVLGNPDLNELPCQQSHPSSHLSNQASHFTDSCSYNNQSSQSPPPTFHHHHHCFQKPAKDESSVRLASQPTLLYDSSCLS